MNYSIIKRATKITGGQLHDSTANLADLRRKVEGRAKGDVTIRGGSIYVNNKPIDSAHQSRRNSDYSPGSTKLNHIHSTRLGTQASLNAHIHANEISRMVCMNPDMNISASAPDCDLRPNGVGSVTGQIGLSRNTTGAGTGTTPRVRRNSNISPATNTMIKAEEIDSCRSRGSAGVSKGIERAARRQNLHHISTSSFLTNCDTQNSNTPNLSPKQLR